MKERGQLVKRGTLSEDGDVEFWEDGTTTSRVKRSTPNPAKEGAETTASSEDGKGPEST